MSSDLNNINENQFLTLDYVKTTLNITDTQDDNEYLRIINTANEELKKEIVKVVDNINAIQGTKFAPRAESVAYTYALSLIRRDINQMYDEAKTIMENYEDQLASLLGDMRAIAPVRTSRQVIVRDVSAEDDYFAERHVP